MFRKSKLTIVLSVCLLLLSSAMLSPVAKAEQNYSITETELTTLITNLEQLKVNLENLKAQLQTSKTELTKLQEQLLTSEQELQTLKNQLNRLEQESKTLSSQLQTAETSLMNASQSFEEYKKEVERRIKSLTIQRNVSWVVTIIVIAATL